MNQEVKKWVDMAEMDYGVAKHLYETYYPKPYEIICYHCQQSAEKIIKGIIIANGSQGGIPKSHTISCGARPCEASELRDARMGMIYRSL